MQSSTKLKAQSSKFFLPAIFRWGLVVALLLPALTPSAFAQTNVVPDEVELGVLKKLYDSLGGANWTNKTNWPTPGNWPATATSAQFGTWRGITVTNGDITAIALSSNNLVGTLPGSIGDLTRLTSFTVQANTISGKIPATLGQLSSLQYLYLHANELTGSISPELGNLSSLKYLRLTDNRLSGSIPGTLGNIGPLVELYLDQNELSGTIPGALGKLSNLTTLYLQANQLTGALPGRLGNLSSLRTFYCNDNGLEGEIPDSLQYLSKLRIFYGGNNNLSGSLPPWIDNTTWPELTHLRFNDNLLSGALPAGLGSLTKVRLFDVSNNDLTGTIPAGCENWNELVTWWSQGNDFTGPLPPDLFANKPALGAINISGNRHEGAFPSITGSPSLTSLRTADNFFTTLPTGVLNSPTLLILNFTNNELTTLPDLSAQVNKTSLTVNVANNRLDFSTMEAAKNAGLKTITLTPQKNFKDITSLDPQEGQPLVLTARPAGSGTIAWEKLQPDGVTWSNVDALNPDDGNALTYRINAYNKATDEGTYRYTMGGSPAFPGIVLRSDPMRVKEQLAVVLDDWAFQYRYDSRHRMTHKKVPGAGWVYMVYDERDRLVLTQDAEQRTKKQWSFTKYDALNRPVMTGLYTHDSDVTQEGMSGLVSTTNFYETYTGNAAYHGYSNTVFPTGGVPASNLEILTVTYYDNYDFTAGWGTEFDYAANQIEDQDVNDQTYAQGNAFTGVIGQVTGTKVRSLEAEPYWMQTVTYYDDRYRPLQVITDNYKKGTDRITNIYDFVGKVLATKTDHLVGTVTWTNGVNVTIADDKLSKSSSGNAWSTSGASSVQQIPAGVYGWVEATVTELNTSRIFGLSTQDVDQNHTTVGYGFLQAGASLSVRISGTVYAVTGLLAIGDKLRIARETSGAINFYRNGIKVNPASMPAQINTAALIADVAFSNSGSSVGRVRISAGQGQRQIVERWMAYDHGGRLMETWHSLNGGTRILLSKNEYNELGQLVDKKLHSTVISAADAKQSVDYRYNIRGWLTSINNAALAADATNDDTNDLFGMNLGYNTALGIAATPQFNGNISAIQYSKDWGQGDVKQTGYAFAYDPMNRLTNAAHKQRTTIGTWGSGGYDEGNITYDLNGNIQALQRKGKNGVLIDNLSYIYENAGNTASNKLLGVQDLTSDPAHKAKGFADGNPGTTQDYTYDANGNMTRDLNKGIGTSLTDATNVIAYNHLNLPQTVSKGGSTIRYVYDATGRKLAQYVTSGASQKRTDYVGEFVYEDNALQFVNHEEGRIVVAKTKLVYTNGFDAVTESAMTGINVGLAAYQSKGEKYVTATSNNGTTGNGVFPIGEAINVGVNERYRIRVKAYAGTSAAYLQTRVNSGSAIVSTSTAVIPNNTTSECWIEQVVTTPASGSNLTLETGVVWHTVSTQERMYLNEIEIIKLETTAPEYQYHLKDHLGNVRLTFTTKDEVETVKATMEEANASAEQSEFLYYDEAVKVKNYLFDHTNNVVVGGPQGLPGDPDFPYGNVEGYATRLTGGTTDEKFGLTKTLSVMPGDVVTMEVFAKYLDPQNTTWTPDLISLIGSLAVGGGAPAGTFIDGGAAGSIGAAAYPIPPIDHSSEDGTEPKAYLNYILYDRDFSTVLDMGYKRITTDAREYGQDATHDRLAFDGAERISIKQTGYMYIYLSNENETPVEVFFDDFAVVHTKSPVVQSEEYYPFGLTFNGYQRENGVGQDYLYNGKEKQTELGLDWYDYGARMYMSEIGRWGVIDPLADSAFSWSPYRYAFDNPVRYTDPDGQFELDEKTAKDNPELVKFLQNLKQGFINKSDEFKQAFYETSGLNEEQTLEMLTYGSGPKILVENLDSETRTVNGKTMTEQDQETGEVSNANGGKGVIKIDNDVVSALKNNSNETDVAAGNVLVESTVLHEGTHYGNLKTNQTNVRSTRRGNGKYAESGKEFETKAYGIDIGRGNAKSYVESKKKK